MEILNSAAGDDPSPAFNARLTGGVPALAAQITPSAWHAQDFQVRYSLMLDGLRSVCQHAAHINLLILEYQQRALQGRAVHFGGALPAVREVIDEPLTAGFEALLNAAYGCLADAFLPLLHAAFDLDLACLLDPIMEPSNLPTLEEPLRNYLLDCHSAWLADLLLLRAAWGRGWRLTPVTYFMEEGIFHIRLPLVNKQPLNLFCRRLANHMCFFCEDSTAFLIASKANVRLAEIPLGQRDPVSPRRFSVLTDNSAVPWTPHLSNAFDFL